MATYYEIPADSNRFNDAPSVIYSVKELKASGKWDRLDDASKGYFIHRDAMMAKEEAAKKKKRRY